MFFNFVYPKVGAGAGSLTLTLLLKKDAINLF